MCRVGRSAMGTLGLNWEVWAADQFFCLYVPVYIPKWTGGWLCSVYTYNPFYHVFFTSFSH